MAHLEKYKASSVGHMLAHYRRDPSSLGRENIDSARVGMDYTLAIDPADGLVKPMEGVEPNWATVEGRIERVNERAKAEGKRAVRKDAVVMADVVVTLPENVRKGDEGAFFGWTYCFLADRLGSGNMLGGFVHRDEVRADGSPVRDHMHAPFTPILDGRFNFKKMCPRTFYQSLHKDLGDYLERCLGYRPEVELGEDTRARRVYTDKSVDIDRVRGAVDKAVVEPAQQEAERIVAAARAQAATIVRDAEMRKAELVTQIADKEGDLAELDSRLSDVRMDIEDEQDRLECLRQRAGGVARDVEELRPVAAEVRGWEAAGKAERGTILDSIAARCAGAARAARAAIEELGDRIWALMRPRKAQRGERSLDDVRREATEAARASEALGRNHVAPTNSRSRGQAR
jgi:uncharacterized coiled-coil protein SlyX